MLGGISTLHFAIDQEQEARPARSAIASAIVGHLDATVSVGMGNSLRSHDDECGGVAEESRSDIVIGDDESIFSRMTE